MSNQLYKAIKRGDLKTIKQLLKEGVTPDAHSWFLAVNTSENIRIFQLFSQSIQQNDASINKKKAQSQVMRGTGQAKTPVYYPLDLVSHLDSELPLFWYAITQEQWTLVAWFLSIQNNEFHYTPDTRCLAECSVTNLNQIIKQQAGIIGPASINDSEWLRSFFLHGLLVWCGAHMEQFDLVKMLLTQLPTKLTFFCPDIYLGQTVLWHAARKDRWDIVSWLLHSDSDNSLLYQSGCEGQSLTWLAAYHGQWEYVEYFLSLSFDDINSYPSGVHEGRSILWLAAQVGQWSTVKLILEHYPEVNIGAHPINPTEDDFLPQASVLQFAEWGSQVEVVDMLKQHQSGKQALDLNNYQSNSSEFIKKINLFIEKIISQFAGTDEAPFLLEKLQKAFKAAAVNRLEDDTSPEYSLGFFKKDKLALMQERIMHVLSEVNLFEVADEVLVEKIQALFLSANSDKTFTP